MAVKSPLTFISPFGIGIIDAAVDDVDMGPAGPVMLGNINMNNFRVYGLPTPTSNADAATKSYVASVVAADTTKRYVMPTAKLVAVSNQALSGLTEGDTDWVEDFADTHSFIYAPSGAICSYDPLWATDEWVGYILRNNTTVEEGVVIGNTTAGVSGNVADFPSGFSIGNSFSIGYYNVLTDREIDSVVIAADDRILLAGQTTGSQNGIWLAQSGAWTRPTADYDLIAGADAAGVLIPISHGTIYADVIWQCTSLVGTIVGTDSLALEPMRQGPNRVYYSGYPAVSDLEEGEIVLCVADATVRCRSNGSIWKAAMVAK